MPDLPDPDRRSYLAQIAAMMDDRTQRLGQHTAQTSPAWAVHALGPVPADRAAWRNWEQNAAPVAAYREAYGYDHPDHPIGPEPSRQAPDQRASWHEAFAVLGPTDGPDIRALPDGRLWLLRDSYAAETAWAPRRTGKELRQARLAAADAAIRADAGADAAIRADAGADAARKADDCGLAGKQDELAASYRAIAECYRQRETVFTQAMADRQAWEHATAGSRRLAIAADTELRRRHPDQEIEPLRSAEPAVSDADREQPHPASGEQTGQMTAWIRDHAAARQAFRAALASRHGLKVPSSDPGLGELAGAFPASRAPWRDGILQPPKPQITPSARMLQHAAEHDAEPEAAD